MIVDVIDVKAVDAHRLQLVFRDGVRGVVDVAGMVPFDGVFAPLRDPAVFASARVNADLGTVTWPNGADLDPAVLYAAITGAPLPGSDRAFDAR